MQSEWQIFLNLCLAQETHLDNIDDYKKVKRPGRPCSVKLVRSLAHGHDVTVCQMQFQLDAEMLSDSLKTLNSNLQPQSLAGMSNPEALLQLEVKQFLCSS